MLGAETRRGEQAQTDPSSVPAPLPRPKRVKPAEVSKNKIKEKQNKLRKEHKGKKAKREPSPSFHYIFFGARGPNIHMYAIDTHGNYVR